MFNILLPKFNVIILEEFPSWPWGKHSSNWLVFPAVGLDQSVIVALFSSEKIVSLPVVVECATLPFSTG